MNYELQIIAQKEKAEWSHHSAFINLEDPASDGLAPKVLPPNDLKPLKNHLLRTTLRRPIENQFLT